MDPIHTRRGMAQAMFNEGYSVGEIACEMLIKKDTVKRYLAPEQSDIAKHRRYGASRILSSQRKSGMALTYDGPDEIEDMIQYKDKYGITRWRAA